MWKRAVWKEADREEELTIPSLWIKNNKVFWPPGKANAAKALKEMQKPRKDWQQFPLVKVKFTSDNQKECEGYDFTTTAELSGEEESLPTKRVGKRKKYDDFVTDPNITGDDEKAIRKKKKNAREEADTGDAKLPDPPQKFSTTNKDTEDILELGHMSEFEPDFEPDSPYSDCSSSDPVQKKRKLQSETSADSSKSDDSSKSEMDDHDDASEPETDEDESPARPWKGSGSEPQARSPQKSEPSSGLSEGELDDTSLVQLSKPKSNSKSTKAKKKVQEQSESSSSSSSESEPESGDISPVKLSSKSSKGSGKKSLNTPKARAESSSESDTDDISSIKLAQPKSAKKGKKNVKTPKAKRVLNPIPQNHSSSKKSKTPSKLRASTSMTPKSTPSTSSGLPMSQARFQRKVLLLLTEMKDKIGRLGRKWEVATSDFHVVQITTLEEFEKQEDSLNDQENCKLLAAQLSNIGGVSVSDCVTNMMQRTMSNGVAAKMNMQGGNGKIAFKKTNLCRVMHECLFRSFKTSEKEVDSLMAKQLQFAPYRTGGGKENRGRKTPQK